MSEEDIKKLVDEVANLKQDKENVVNELKELRAKKPDQIDPAMIETKAKEIVERLLNEESGKKFTEIRIDAEKNFKQSFKEFHPDNDPGGIKYTAFQNTLTKMNLSGLKTAEEFAEAFEDAYLVMNKKSIKNGAYSNHADLNPIFAPDARSVDGDNLSLKELKLIKQQGMDKAVYIKMREKRPSYVQELLKWIN